MANEDAARVQQGDYSQFSGLQAIIGFFSGDEKNQSVEEFFEGLDEAKRRGNWDDALTIRIAHRWCKGEAKAFLRNEHDIRNCNNYNDFKTKFKQHFRPRIPLAVRISNLLDAKQKANEDVAAYASRMRELSRLTAPENETADAHAERMRTLTATFLKGLLPRIQRPVLSRAPQNMAEAAEFALQEECNEKMVRNPRGVAAVEGEIESENKNANSDKKIKELTQNVSQLVAVVEQNKTEMKDLQDKFAKKVTFDEHNLKMLQQEKEQERTNSWQPADRNRFGQQARPNWTRPWREFSNRALPSYSNGYRGQRPNGNFPRGQPEWYQHDQRIPRAMYDSLYPRNGNAGNEQREINNRDNRRDNVLCFRCQRPGHFARHCNARIDGNERALNGQAPPGNRRD